MSTNIHDYIYDQFNAYHTKAIKPMDDRLTDIETLDAVEVTQDSGHIVVTARNGSEGYIYDGESAYQTWLSVNGYDEATHTAAEFISSLKGVTGDKGDKGDKGDTGSGFMVDRIYSSISDMLAASPTEDSNFVLVEDTVNGISNLYLRQSSYTVNTAAGEVVGSPNYNGYIFWGTKSGVSVVNGKSAYEIWLDQNGYAADAHDETEFLNSLRGADGSTIMSLTQAQYDALADDATGKLNPSVMYNITDSGYVVSDILTQTEGKAYIESKISLIKPSIGTDKYWYYGNTKTTFKAEGEDGRDGIDGKDGITIVEITKSAYNALPNDTTGKLNPMVMYHISDETELQPLYTQTQIDAMFAEIDRRLKNGGL